MGSSGGEGPEIDPTVGGLVWVRRRNGSWWPGRIMDMDELPEGSLVSPRSGTPVKLLGREDASVDWYNLERSKRVKPFRCGEFDDCIEKAKAAANANKKAVKYARRDDAILHALEIESAREPKDQVEYIPRTDNSGSEQDFSSSEDSPTVSDSATIEDSDEETDTDDTSTSVLELSQSGTSFEEPNHISVPKVQTLQGRRRRTPNDSEDDGNEGIKRMRGLEDLGLGMVSKKSVQAGEILEGVHEDNVCIDNHMIIGSLANGSKDNAPLLKRKRSQAAHVQEFLKRKDRRRPLTKVLEKSPMLVSVPIMFDPVLTPSASPHHGVYDSKVSRLDISNNSTGSTGVSNERGTVANGCERVSNVSHNQNKLTENGISSMSGFPEFNSDMLYDVPLVVEEENYFAGSHMTTSSTGQPKFGAQSNEAETALLENEGLHKVSLTTSATTYSNISQMMEKDTSMWQSKGKRKSRRMSKSIKHDLKNFVDADDESDDYLVGVEHNNGFSHWGKDPPSYREPQRSLPYRQSRFSVHPKYDEMEDYPIKNLRLGSSLYDVVLEVKASYRPQHVPLVSLMSKLNGKAIVGHPLTVEVLDDATSDHLVTSVYEFGYAAKSNIDVGKDARFSPKKSPRNRKSGFSLKKTRKLSSLTSFQKMREENRKPFVEKLNGPAIACIPLKVVFTRLNEAVSGSSRPTQRVLSENIP